MTKEFEPIDEKIFKYIFTLDEETDYNVDTENVQYDTILRVFNKYPHELVFCWLDEQRLNNYQSEIGHEYFNDIKDKIYERYARALYFIIGKLPQESINNFPSLFYETIIWLNRYLKTFRKSYYEDFESQNVEHDNILVEYIDIVTDGIDNFTNNSPAFQICPDCLYSFKKYNSEGYLVECDTCEGTGWI